MTETEAVEAVRKAWTDAGPVPKVHEAAQRRLRAEWPTLAAAIEKLVATAEAE